MKLFVVQPADIELEHKRARTLWQESVHPDGSCTCGGEGYCYWCQTHCGQCGTSVPATTQSCPYQSDVNDDPHFRCNCCATCWQKCAEEI